jgi:hypothetical protein
MHRAGRQGLFLFAILTALLLAGVSLRAQAPDPSQIPTPPNSPVVLPPPPSEASQTGNSIKSTVEMVVLHVTVTDDRGVALDNLSGANFRVFEDKVEQKVSLFSHEDIPLTMGLVVDNSGSMREKRAQVNAAALTFVKTSNPKDEAFVVNFNDEYYLDTEYVGRALAYRFARQHGALRCGDRFTEPFEEGAQRPSRAAAGYRRRGYGKPEFVCGCDSDRRKIECDDLCDWSL